MNLLEKSLKSKNIKYNFFSYLNKYKESDYINALKKQSLVLY